MIFKMNDGFNCSLKKALSITMIVFLMMPYQGLAQTDDEQMVEYVQSLNDEIRSKNERISSLIKDTNFLRQKLALTIEKKDALERNLIDLHRKVERLENIQESDDVDPAIANLTRQKKSLIVQLSEIRQEKITLKRAVEMYKKQLHNKELEIQGRIFEATKPLKQKINKLEKEIFDSLTFNAVKEYEDLQLEIKAVQKTNDELESEVTQLKKDLSKKTDMLEDQQGRLLALYDIEKSNNSLTQKLKEAKAKILSYQQQSEDAEQWRDKYTTLEKRYLSVVKDVAVVREEIKIYRDDLSNKEDLIAKLQPLADERNQLLAQITEFKEQLKQAEIAWRQTQTEDAAQWEVRYDKLTKEVKDLESDNHRLQKDIKALEQNEKETKQVLGNNKDLKEKVFDLQAKVTELTNVIKEKNNLLEDYQAVKSANLNYVQQMSLLNEDLETTREELDNLSQNQTQFQAVSDENRQLKVDLKQLKTEYQSLEAEFKNLSDVQRNVLALNDEKGHLLEKIKSLQENLEQSQQSQEKDRIKLKDLEKIADQKVLLEDQVRSYEEKMQVSQARIQSLLSVEETIFPLQQSNENLKQRIAFLDNELSHSKSMIEMAELKAEQADILLVENKELKASTIDLKNQIEKLRQQTDRLSISDQELQTKRTKNQDLEKQLKTLELEIRVANQTITKLTQQQQQKISEKLELDGKFSETLASMGNHQNMINKIKAENKTLKAEIENLNHKLSADQKVIKQQLATIDQIQTSSAEKSLKDQVMQLETTIRDMRQQANTKAQDFAKKQDETLKKHQTEIKQALDQNKSLKILKEENMALTRRIASLDQQLDEKQVKVQKQNALIQELEESERSRNTLRAQIAKLEKSIQIEQDKAEQEREKITNKFENKLASLNDDLARSEKRHAEQLETIQSLRDKNILLNQGLKIAQSDKEKIEEDMFQMLTKYKNAQTSFEDRVYEQCLPLQLDLETCNEKIQQFRVKAERRMLDVQREWNSRHKILQAELDATRQDLIKNERIVASVKGQRDQSLLDLKALESKNLELSSKVTGLSNDLSVQKDKYETQIKRLTQQIIKWEASVDDKHAQMKSLHDKDQALRQDLLQAKVVYENINQEWLSVKDRFKIQSGDMDGMLLKFKQQHDRQVAKLKTEMSRLNQARSTANSDKNSLSDQLKTEQKLVVNLERDLENHQVKYKTLKSDYAKLKTLFEEKNQTITELKADLKTKKQEVKELNKDIKVQFQVDQHQDQIAQITKALEASQQELIESQNQFQALQEKVIALESDKSELQKNLSGFVQEKQNLESLLDELKAKQMQTQQEKDTAYAEKIESLKAKQELQMEQLETEHTQKMVDLSDKMDRLQAELTQASRSVSENDQQDNLLRDKLDEAEQQMVQQSKKFSQDIAALKSNYESQIDTLKVQLENANNKIEQSLIDQNKILAKLGDLESIVQSKEEALLRKDQEINEWLAQSQKLMDEHESQKKYIESLEKDLNFEKTAFKNAMSQVDTLEIQLQQKKNELEDVRVAHDQSQIDLKIFKTQITDADKSRTIMSKELQELQAQYEIKQKAISELETELDELRNTGEVKLSQREQKYANEVNTLKAELEMIREESSQRQTQLASEQLQQMNEFKNKIDDLVIDIANKDDMIIKLNRDKKELLISLDQLKAERIQFTDDIQSMTREIAELKIEKQKTQEQLKDKNDANARMAASIDQLSADMDQKHGTLLKVESDWEKRLQETVQNKKELETILSEKDKQILALEEDLTALSRNQESFDQERSVLLQQIKTLEVDMRTATDDWELQTQQQREDWQAEERRLNDLIDDMTQQFGALEKDFSQLKVDRDELETTNNKLSQQVTANETTMNQLRETVRDYEAQVEQINRQYQDQLKALNAEISAVRKTISEKDEQIEQWILSNNKLSDQLEELNEQKAMISASLNQANQQWEAEKESLQDELDLYLKEEKTALMNDREKLQDKVRAMEQRQAEAETDLKARQSTIERLKADHEAQTSQMQEQANLERQTKEQKIVELQLLNEQLNGDLQLIVTQKASLETQIERLTQQIDDISNRHEDVIKKQAEAMLAQETDLNALLAEQKQDWQTKVNGLNAQIITVKTQLQANREEFQNYQDKIVPQQMEDLKAPLTKTIKSLEQQLVQSEEMLKDKEQFFQELQKKYDDMQELKIALQKQNDRHDEQFKAIESFAEEKAQDLQRLQSLLDESQNQQQQLQSDFEALAVERNQLLEQVSSLESKISVTQDQHALKLTELKQNHQAELQKFLKRLDEAKANLNASQDLVKNLEDTKQKNSKQMTTLQKNSEELARQVESITENMLAMQKQYDMEIADQASLTQTQVEQFQSQQSELKAQIAEKNNEMVLLKKEFEQMKKLLVFEQEDNVSLKARLQSITDDLNDSQAMIAETIKKVEEPLKIKIEILNISLEDLKQTNKDLKEKLNALRQ